jgi:hypothetical protein
MASRKASAEGKALIKQRRIELGWNFCDPKIAIAFGQIVAPELDWKIIGEYEPFKKIAESSIRRFQGGKAIRAKSFNILCQVLGLDPNLVADKTHEGTVVSLTNDTNVSIIDLISMPKDDFFFGRENELKEITKWLNESTPFVNIWGAPGIGKSSLIAHWVKQQKIFSNVIWQSIDCELDDIPCKDFIEDLLAKVVPSTERSRNCFQDFNKMLFQHKMLIVIDGRFNDDYRQWFKSLEKQRHSSCVIVISEPNLEIVISNKNASKARQIGGLDIEGVELLWKYLTQDLCTSESCHNSLEVLRKRYDGNPTWLIAVIESIKINYAGKLSEAMDKTLSMPEWSKESCLKKPFDNLLNKKDNPPDKKQQILIEMAWAEDSVSLDDIKFLTQQNCSTGDLDSLRHSSMVRISNINDEPWYSISTLWRKYLRLRFPRG